MLRRTNEYNSPVKGAKGKSILCDVFMSHLLQPIQLHESERKYADRQKNRVRLMAGFLLSVLGGLL